MDPRLLNYYNRELAVHSRDGAGVREGISENRRALGHRIARVHRSLRRALLESFAFLTARVQMKIDAEFPRFAQHLLHMVYPHYLAPTPPWPWFSFSRASREGALADGFKVPRGSALKSLIGRGEQTACEYRTAHDVTLWPLEMAGAEYTSFLGDLGNLRIPGKAKAALRLKLHATAGLNFDQIALDELPLYLRGGDEVAMRLYELLLAHTVALVVRPAGKALRGARSFSTIRSGPGLRGRPGALALRAPLVPRLPALAGILCLPQPLPLRQPGTASRAPFAAAQRPIWKSSSCSMRKTPAWKRPWDPRSSSCSARRPSTCSPSARIAFT
jgi:hypothetical protein